MDFNTSQVPADIYGAVQRITQAGGRALLVGGAVIDVIQGREPKDWDLEVFGLGYGRLEEIFSDCHPKTVGKAFGVLKVVMGEHDVDINVPRRDNKMGVGHKGFEAIIDPNMTPEGAARRRDFTINAMGVDLLTGEIIDPFGGMEDLHKGRLKATDPELFVEDPLRALRAMQLLPRKAKFIELNTLHLIRGMVSSYPELAKERVYEEFRKLLLKADKPSIGLDFLRELGFLPYFPELEALIGCPQRPEWHPEGDVWVHSLLTADAAAQVRHTVPEHQREAFMFGAFCHDLGKPEMTITTEMMERRDPRVLAAAKKANKPVEDMWLTAHGHDLAGMDPMETFLRRMTDNKKVIELSRAIVGHHLQPWGLYTGGAKKGGYARLHRRMMKAGGDLRLIGRMCQCDACATSADWKTRSLAGGTPNWEHATSERVWDFAEQFDADDAAVSPKVLGRDLIAAGMKPGPDFGKLLKKALDIQDGDSTLGKDDILSQVLPAEFQEGHSA